MKIDNFNKIQSLLSFDSEDDFYFLQIIKRRKDNPDLPRSEKLIRNYFIGSGDLEKCKKSIITICEVNNARAYFRLNRRSYKNVAHRMNVKLAQYLCDGQYRACETLFDSICGEYHCDPQKKWLIDIDSISYADVIPYYEIIEKLDNYKPLTETFSSKDGHKFCREHHYHIIKTLNGYHIITAPFNTQLFNQQCLINNLEIPEIHKDNPTLLYFNNTDDVH